MGICRISINCIGFTTCTSNFKNCKKTAENTLKKKKKRKKLARALFFSAIHHVLKLSESRIEWAQLQLFLQNKYKYNYSSSQCAFLKIVCGMGHA